MLDRREGTKTLASWGAVIAAVAPVAFGLVSFFWGQASAANERVNALERREAAVAEILKSIDQRLERIENRLEVKRP